MRVDRTTERFLKSQEKEREELARKKEKLEAARKELARAAAASEGRQEKWHRFKLAYRDRLAGFEGRHADARDQLRQMPVGQYCSIIYESVPQDSSMTLAQAELAVIERDFEALTAAANERYLARDAAAYGEALEKWQDHDTKNPNSGGWRLKPATREQWLIIDRIVVARGLEDVPRKMTRGEAHDWIDQQGGNPRYDAGPLPANRPPGRDDLLASAAAASLDGNA
jgi:hypothetical protein